MNGKSKVIHLKVDVDFLYRSFKLFFLLKKNSQKATNNKKNRKNVKTTLNTLQCTNRSLVTPLYLI